MFKSILHSAEAAGSERIKQQTTIANMDATDSQQSAPAPHRGKDITSILPQEIYHLVLSHVDFATIQALKQTNHFHRGMLTDRLVRILLGAQTVDEENLRRCYSCHRHDPSLEHVVWTYRDEEPRKGLAAVCVPCAESTGLARPYTNFRYIRHGGEDWIKGRTTWLPSVTAQVGMLPYCRWCSRLPFISEDRESVHEKCRAKLTSAQAWHCAYVPLRTLLLLYFQSVALRSYSDNGLVFYSCIVSRLC